MSASFKLAVLVGTISSVIGLIIGGLAAAWLLGGMLNQSVLSSAEAQLTQDSVELEKLSRGGVPGATRVLQDKVDINLVEVSSFLAHDYKLADGMPETLERIRSTRATMGYAPANPAVRERVQGVLTRKGEGH